MSRPADVLFHVQHLLGIGHLRRAALIARAMDARGLSVAFVSGGLPVPDLDVGAARTVQLPPLRSADAAFSGLVDENGQPVDRDWRDRRTARLLALFEQVRPRLVMTETFPFGRRQLRFELIPLLEAARRRAPRPLVVASIRDVLNPQDKPEKTRWILETARRFYDRVLVHGDPALVPLEHSFPAAGEVADLLDYTGYVVRPAATEDGPPAEHAGEVLVSTGGGAVAEPLVEAALAARPLSPLAGRPWRILVGHNLPAARFEAYRQQAAPGITVERARPDFLRLLARCSLSISQAGYNTVLEVLAARKPAVVVPFAAPGEREQTLRAELLAARGLLAIVEEATLSPESLAQGIESALEQERSEHGLLIDGARRTAEMVAGLLAEVSR